MPLDKLALVTAGSDRGDWYLGAAEKLIGKREVERLTDATYEFLDGEMATARQMTKELGLAGQSAEAFRFLLKSLAVRLQLAAAGSPGSWRSNQYEYALWGQWFGSEPNLDIDSHTARIELAEWYLQGHGPATPEDFAWWGGLKKANARTALAASSAAEVDGWYDLPHLAPAPEPTGVRLLPIWDTALVRQEEWRRMVPPAEFDRVYDASGNLTSTVVRDGVVVGVWDREVKENRLLVKVAGFGRLAKATRGGIEAEAQLIGISLGLGDVEVEYHQDPVDLRQASRNRFMSPLSGRPAKS